MGPRACVKILERKNMLQLPGINPWIIQPITNPYTKCAVPAVIK